MTDLPDFGDDAAPKVGDNLLAQIRESAEAQRKAEADLEAAKEDVDVKTKALNRIMFGSFPNLMEEGGIPEFKLDDGTKIELKRTVQAKVSANGWPEAVKWLDENGHGKIVDRSITLKFDREDEGIVELVKKLLEDNGLMDRVEFSVEETVHHSRLKAFIGDLVKKGVDVPKKTFGVHTVKSTKVSVK